MPDDAARLNVIEEAYADWHPDIADHVAWLLAQLAAREGDVEKLKAIADDVVSDWQREKHQADTLGAQLAAREAEVARLREKLSGCVKRHDSTAALRADLRTVAEALAAVRPYFRSAASLKMAATGRPIYGDLEAEKLLTMLDAALALDAVQEVREAP